MQTTSTEVVLKEKETKIVDLLKHFKEQIETLTLDAMEAGIDISEITAALRLVASFYGGDVLVETYRGMEIRCDGESFSCDDASSGACATVEDVRAEIDAEITNNDAINVALREAGLFEDDEAA